jgi:hypothetical protein
MVTLNPNKADNTVINLDKDDDSNSEATTKETNTAESTPRSTAEAKDFSAEKVFMDLKFKMPPNEDLMEAMDLAIERSKQWYLDMLRIKPSLKLHTVDPDNHTITQLDDPANFPTTLPDAKEFFHGLRPNLRGGYTNVKVLASCKLEMKKMAKEVEFYHHAKKESFTVSPIQSHSTKWVCWLLYSTRATDCKHLGEVLTQRLGKEVSCRFMRINDKQKYDKDDPHAVHIQSSEEDVEDVQALMSKLYSSKAEHFPLGMRMRYVSIVTDISSMQGLTKFNLLRNRQDGWCAQHQAKTVASLAVIDTEVGKTSKTLREMIMEIPATTGNTETPLFMAINAPWKGKGFVISYHPAKADEASTTINGMYPRLLAKYGDAINNFFTSKGIKKGRTMKWDSTTNQVTSIHDEELNGVFDADPEMADLDKMKATDEATTGVPKRGEVFTFQKERTDDDSISTMGGGGTRRSRQDDTATPSKKKPRTQTVTMDTDNNSNASSLTGNTKYTIQTKMSTMETTITDMQSGMKNMEQMMSSMMATFAPAGSGRGEPPAPVTPGLTTAPQIQDALTSRHVLLGSQAKGPEGSLADG